MCATEDPVLKAISYDNPMYDVSLDSTPPSDIAGIEDRKVHTSVRKALLAGTVSIEHDRVRQLRTACSSREDLALNPFQNKIKPHHFVFSVRICFQ